MTKQNQIYKCNICGNIVEVLHVGAGELVCCGQPMELLEEKTQDEGREKHVPVIEKTENSIKVKVGSVPHPLRETTMERENIGTYYQAVITSNNFSLKSFSLSLL